MCKYQLLQRPGAPQESIESPKNTTTSQSGEFMSLPGPGTPHLLSMGALLLLQVPKQVLEIHPAHTHSEPSNVREQHPLERELAPPRVALSSPRRREGLPPRLADRFATTAPSRRTTPRPPEAWKHTTSGLRSSFFGALFPPSSPLRFISSRRSDGWSARRL